MKKVLITGVLAVLAMSSCKKDRTCTCTTAGSTTTDVKTYTSVTKGQMKANCYSYTLKIDTYTEEVTCKFE